MFELSGPIFAKTILYQHHVCSRMSGTRHCNEATPSPASSHAHLLNVEIMHARTTRTEKAPMIAKVAKHLYIGWSKLWDQTLCLGGRAVLGLQNISRAMSHRGRGIHPCHLFKEETTLRDVTLWNILLQRTNKNCIYRANLLIVQIS